MKKIIFPFDIGQDNRAAYNKAMDTAKKTGAKLIFFTALDNYNSITRDKVYLHLLELYGYYQTFSNNWQAKPKVQSERIIKSGAFKPAFQQFLQNTTVDWVVPTGVLQNDYFANSPHEPNYSLVENVRPDYPHLYADNNRL